MQAVGIVQPSQSPYSPPMVLVKKDGSVHFCIDYHKLNENMKSNTSNAVFQGCIGLSPGVIIFATLDFMSGYWQIHKKEEDIEKMAFTCLEGLFEFT